MEQNETCSIVTEVGVFGELNIEDPTETKVTNKKKNDANDIDEMIKESIEANRNITA